MTPTGAPITCTLVPNGDGNASLPCGLKRDHPIVLRDSHKAQTEVAIHGQGKANTHISHRENVEYSAHNQCHNKKCSSNTMKGTTHDYQGARY